MSNSLMVLSNLNVIYIYIEGDTKAVFDSYNMLALYFRDNKDAKTGLYFYEKCLEISRLTMDVAGEMGANHNLGVTHELSGDISSAITFHEMHLKLAKKHVDPVQQKTANLELLKVFLIFELPLPLPYSSSLPSSSPIPSLSSFILY